MTESTCYLITVSMILIFVTIVRAGFDITCTTTPVLFALTYTINTAASIGTVIRAGSNGIFGCES